MANSATSSPKMLGPTAILNHAYRQHQLPLVHLETEGLRAGFRGKAPADRQTVAGACRGKAFLNFDDEAFGPVLHRYLAEQFPDAKAMPRAHRFRHRTFPCPKFACPQHAFALISLAPVFTHLSEAPPPWVRTLLPAVALRLVVNMVGLT